MVARDRSEVPEDDAGLVSASRGAQRGTGTQDVRQSALERSHDLGQALGKGFLWSMLNNVVGKLGSFVAGIVVIRLLSQGEYGVYAVGMVVLSVLLSMNELGVSVAIVQRRGSLDDIAPTVATISISSSAVMAALAFIAAPAVAAAMKAPEATWLIRLLSVGVLIDGFAAVPNALITRAMQQRKRLVIDTVAFLVGTPLTIGLAMAGYGAWSLGWGAVVGNVVTGLLSYLWAPARYRPGWRYEAIPELLRFGMPLAGASLLLFLLMNVDYVVVGHLLGPVELGIYLLAFNVASWPTTVIAAAIRRVTLAAFARLLERGHHDGAEGFARICGIVMAVTFPACALLSVYALPTLRVLYGGRWSEAAPALQLLVIFSAGRIAVEVTYDFLAASGRTHFTIWLHLVWLAVLLPAVVVAARHWGLIGVAIAHALVVLVVLLPVLLLMLRRSGVLLRDLGAHTVRPLLGVAVIALSGRLLLEFPLSPLLVLLTGGLVSGLCYLAVVWPMRKTAMLLWNMTD